MQEESQFYDGPVKEAISWRRLEQRLELEEMDAIREANSHALRVLQHEMQFMPPYRKRQYMKYDFFKLFNFTLYNCILYNFTHAFAGA